MKKNPQDKNSFDDKYQEKDKLELLKAHLNLISYDIYSRIAFAWRFGLPLSEETITEQYILYQYYTLALSRNYPLTVLASKKEHLTGNDIEIAIETDKGFILFPCQAKKVKYKGHKYLSINHKVRSSQKYQIDLLLEYAERVKGIPIYMLYNSIIDDDMRQEIFDSLPNGVGLNILSSFGSSLTSAKWIKDKFFTGLKWKSPNFLDFYPHNLKPYSFIVDILNHGLENQSLDSLMYGIDLKDVRYYTKKEVLDDEFWDNLVPRPSISGLPIPTLYSDSNSYKTNNQIFNPRFRLVIGKRDLYTKKKIMILE